MGGVCSMYGGEREVRTGFWGRKPDRRKPLGRLGVDGRIPSFLKYWERGVD